MNDTETEYPSWCDWYVTEKPRNVSYWLTRMKRTNRMSFDDEVTRLTTALYGFYVQCPQDDSDNYSVFDHFYSKRPYGIKNIPASIAFNLGWDIERRLYKDDNLPGFVIDECRKLHIAVLERVKKHFDE